MEALTQYRVDLVVLAGFLSILSADFVRRWPDRIVNVHPSLIPAFCGKGYYGLKVHEAALRRGVKVTGATVHLVNEIPDGGRILLQKAVDVLPGDTPETLQRRVMEQAEWVLLPQAAEQLAAAHCHGKGGASVKQDLCAAAAGQSLSRPWDRAGHDAGRQVVRGRLFHHGPQRQQPQPRLRGGAGRHPHPGVRTPPRWRTPASSSTTRYGRWAGDSSSPTATRRTPSWSF